MPEWLQNILLYNPFQMITTGIGKGIEWLGSEAQDVWNNLTGKTANEQVNKAQQMAEESQNFNEQFSKQQLAENARQFDLSFAQANDNIAYQKDIMNKNLAMQQDVFNAQLRENQLTREREDTAYQRQIADLKAAGFSPLMASNGAGAAAMQLGSAPQYDVSGVSSAQGSALNIAKEYAQLRNMIAGQYLTNRQAAVNAKIGAQMALKDIETSKQSMFLNTFNLGLNAAKTITDINTKLNQDNWMKEHGYRNQNTWSVLLPVLEKLADNLGIDYEKLGGALKNIPGAVTNINNRLFNVSDNEIQKTLNETLPDNKLTQDDLSKLTMLYMIKPKRNEEIRNELQSIYNNMPSIHNDMSFINFYELFTGQNKKDIQNFFKKYIPDLGNF